MIVQLTIQSDLDERPDSGGVQSEGAVRDCSQQCQHGMRGQ